MTTQIAFDSFDIFELIEGLAAHYKEKIVDEGVEHFLQIPPTAGSGKISSLDFKDGLSMLLFDCELEQPLTLKITENKEHPLRMICGVECEIDHTISPDLQFSLGALEGGIVSGITGNFHIIEIPSGKRIVFYWINIDRKKYHSKISRAIAVMPEELRKVFNDTGSERSFFYRGTYNLGILQNIQNIRGNTFHGAVRRVYTESQTLEIMSMLIKQYIDDLLPGKKQSVLRKRDMELIVEARKKLLVNLVNPPTIRELAQVMGTNENKLKAGFRLLYDTSINKLLQDERLTKAKLLMAEESYPIKEVAKMVGYKHSAHFASKFKKRFGILPNEYIRSISR